MASQERVITNQENKTIATVRRVAVGKYEVSRYNNRDELVNLGSIFSPMDVEEIRRWARGFRYQPTWDEWQRLPAYRRSKSRKQA